jgi:hypothetical protein
LPGSSRAALPAPPRDLKVTEQLLHCVRAGWRLGGGLSCGFDQTDDVVNTRNSDFDRFWRETIRVSRCQFARGAPLGVWCPQGGHGDGWCAPRADG